MATAKVRYRYRRERSDGSVNETTCLRTFEKWLKEIVDGDAFFVARCQWVQCERDGTVISGGHEVQHVRWVHDVEAVEN